MRACLEDNSRTNAVGDSHLNRDLGQNSLHAERSVARETREDDWIGEETSLPRRPQGQVNLPPLRLEPFDGDCTKWPEFSAGFKALIHDVVQTDYQRMAYLRMYLTPEIRSGIAGLLTQPSHYHEALQALKSRYGHPGLLAKANTALITSLPVVKPGDPQSLSKFVGRLNDIIANLNRTGQAEELKSTTVVEITRAKLPRDLRCLWGEEISRNYQATSLVRLKNWLEIKLMGQRFGHNYLAQTEQRKESGIRGREIPRKVHNTAVRSNGVCAICRENHRTQECPTFGNADPTRRNELVKNIGCVLVA